MYVQAKEKTNPHVHATKKTNLYHTDKQVAHCLTKETKLSHTPSSRRKEVVLYKVTVKILKV
jgi:hypothetical protein